MQKTLKTNRLTLRPLAPVDEAWLISFLRTKEVYWNLGSIPPNVDADFVQARIKHAREGEEAQIAFIRMIEIDEERAGIVSLDRNNTREAWSLGYAIHPDFNGQGIATEAAEALLNWAHNNSTQGYFVSGYFADNPASGNVLRKLGFLPCWRGDVFGAGRQTKADHVYMSRMAE